MANGFTIELKGLDKALSALDVNKYRRDVKDELNAFGLDVVARAKVKAPVDEGRLQQLISFSPGTDLSITISSGADYSAYLEFGTRKFAEIYIATLPADWQEFASQYKGNGGGSFQDLVMNLVRWCKVKGIPEKAAYPIAIKILRDGIPAQPFLYPAVTDATKDLIKNLQTLI